MLWIRQYFFNIYPGSSSTEFFNKLIGSDLVMLWITQQ